MNSKNNSSKRRILNGFPEEIPRKQILEEFSEKPSGESQQIFIDHKQSQQKFLEDFLQELLERLQYSWRSPLLSVPPGVLPRLLSGISPRIPSVILREIFLRISPEFLLLILSVISRGIFSKNLRVTPLGIAQRMSSSIPAVCSLEFPPPISPGISPKISPRTPTDFFIFNNSHSIFSGISKYSMVSSRHPHWFFTDCSKGSSSNFAQNSGCDSYDSSRYCSKDDFGNSCSISSKDFP